MSASDRTEGYSRISILVHWLTAIFVVILFITHEGERGDLAYAIHVGGGALVGLFLLWRVGYRMKRGMTRAPDQSPALNVVSAIVLWGLLLTIFVVTLSGYFLPWADGVSLNIFGTLAVPSPMSANPPLLEFMETVHEISGHLIPILLGLHILGAAKHLIIDRDTVVRRMLKALPGGR